MHQMRCWKQARSSQPAPSALEICDMYIYIYITITYMHASRYIYPITISLFKYMCAKCGVGD